MKSVMLLVVGLTLIASTAMASDPIDVPDGGSCALLVGMAMFGVGMVRRLLR